MENNFYRDQFEQMLKDTTDNFRMYPSRKIWHSIYNDLHPAKRWPSLAVLLILITSIMYIGVANPDHPDAATANNNPETNRNTIASNIESAQAYVERNHQPAIKAIKQQNPVLQSNDQAVSASAVSSSTMPLTNVEVAALTANKTSPVSDHTQFQVAIENSQADASVDPENNVSATVMNKVQNDPEVTTPFTEITIQTTPAQPDAVTPDADPLKSSVAIKIKDAETNTAELEMMEDFAFHNSVKKGKERWSYQLYATPSVGYRTLSKTEFAPEAGSRSSLIAPESQDEYFLNHGSALNLEAGGNLLYNVTKKLRVKAGIQFNYTNYYISAYELNHPVATSLLLNDNNTGLPAVESRSSMLSNSQSLANTHLNNNTYQLSIPLGADFQIAGGKTLKWFAGATIQPTYVAGGNAFYVSTDMKNYITDPSLLRKFNMNGGLETFISYQLKSGVAVNAGPQVRYQLLSTYNTNYNYSEKLFNFGVKLGITSRF